MTGDCNLGINGCYRGTSRGAMAFVAAWCNDYLAKAGMPIRCRALAGDEVSMADGSPLVEGLAAGAVAVCGCSLMVDHYVLVTGLADADALVFDPFYEECPPQSFELPQDGVRWVWDCPFSHNREVSRAVMDDPQAPSYSLYAASGRDAVLVWRTDDARARWHD